MPVVHDLCNLLFIDPPIDKVNDFFDWEFELNTLFLAESLPFFPVFEPFSEYHYLVLVDFAFVCSAIRDRAIYSRRFDVSQRFFAVIIALKPQ